LKGYQLMFRNFITLSFLSFIFLFSLNSQAQTPKERIEKIPLTFQEGEFTTVLDELEVMEQNLADYRKVRKDIIGFVAYWRGATFAQIQNFEKALINYGIAEKEGFETKEFWYEYGQALFVADQLKQARIAFGKSVKKEYKVAVSLYYMAAISATLKESKKAVSLFNTIEKLPNNEKKDVVQAARVQVGDIYLSQIEKMPDSFSAVEKYVIPQYEKALEWDTKSKLAAEIKQKIENLQKKYDLVLFKMRNGRPTIRPPYLLLMSAAQVYDNNLVNDSDDEKKAKLDDDGEVAAWYNIFSFFGRYTFYINDELSIAPSLIGSFTKYQSSEDSTQALDSYNLSSGLVGAYEFVLFDRQATFYLDYTYGKNHGRPIDAEGQIESTFKNNSNSHTVTVSQEFQAKENFVTTFRYRRTQAGSEEEDSGSVINSIVWEQLFIFPKGFTGFMFASYDMARNDIDAGDTDGYIIRFDLFTPTIKERFIPNIYTSVTSTSYINDTDKDATRLLINGVNLSYRYNRSWNYIADFGYHSMAAALDEDEYTKQVFSLRVDYLF